MELLCGKAEVQASFTGAMMKNILCFGDSNTFGWDPDRLTRFEKNRRWTGILAGLLGNSYYVIEEGLGGRTFGFDDPELPGRNAAEYLLPCVLSHQPLDLVIMMLGTNDLKACFSPTLDQISRKLEHLIRILKNPEIWDNKRPPQILIVSPVWFGNHLPETPFHRIFCPDSVEMSHDLAETLCRTAGKYGCEFMDAALYAKASQADAIHMDVENHGKLARAIFEKLRKIEN